MRELADEARIRRFASELARRAPGETRVYLTGGATAVLEDVESMLRSGLVDPDRLRDQLHRLAVSADSRTRFIVSFSDR